MAGAGHPAQDRAHRCVPGQLGCDREVCRQRIHVDHHAVDEYRALLVGAQDRSGDHPEAWSAAANRPPQFGLLAGAVLAEMDDLAAGQHDVDLD